MADWSQQYLAHSHCWLTTSTDFQQRGSFGMSRQRYTLHRLGGGGATNHRLQYRDLPPSRRRGRWTSKRTLERCVPDAFLHHQNRLSRKVCRPHSVLLQSSRFVSLQKKTTESPATSPVQPPRCNGKCTGVHSVLRSGVGQRSFVHTVSSLGALPFLGTWDENKEQADDAHDTTPDTLGWTVSSDAYGGRALVWSCKPLLSQVHRFPDDTWQLA